MASHSLTFLQSAHLPFAISHFVLSSIWVTLKAPFRGSSTPRSFNRHLILAISRQVLSSIYTQQLQYNPPQPTDIFQLLISSARFFAGTTESNYKAWAKTSNQQPRRIEIKSINTKAFWIGDPNADNVILYIHGGRFAMPASDAHFSLCSALVNKAQKSGKSVAALVLQYDLAPKDKYPRQLNQSVELLRYTIEVLGKSPDKIMLKGDSSGGNLIFGVLSHMMHPHPAIAPLHTTHPIKGAVMCSPVCILNTENPRFRTHEGQDPAAADTIKTWLSDYLGPSAPDAWSQPLTNDASWWSGLDRVVEGVLITVASEEMMAEDTEACFNIVKKSYSGAILFSSKVDFHAEPGIGPMLGYKHGETADMMISYAVDRFP